MQDKDKALQTLKKLVNLGKHPDYETIPPTIDEFLDDPDYLGETGKGVYDEWRVKLRELFPDNFTTSSVFVVQSGAIGIGKSVSSRIIMAYNLCRINCLKNLSKTLNKIESQSNYTIAFYNTNQDKVKKALIEPFNRLLESSPYFRRIHDVYKRYSKFPIDFKVVSLVRDLLSIELVGAILSEVNFVNIGADVVNQTIIRCESRTKAGYNSFINVILDSSETSEDSVTRKFVQEGNYRDNTVVFGGSQWKFKPKEFDLKNTFHVYIGDAQNSPFILTSPLKEYKGLQLDRVFEVPIKLKSNFNSDITKSIRDLLGQPTGGAGMKFFPSGEIIDNAFNIECLLPTEPIIVSDAINGDLLDIESVKEIIYTIPKDKKLYCHVDLGLRNDCTGLAITYANNLVSGQSSAHAHIKYKTPLLLRISREKEGQTSIQKITDFILSLMDNWTFGKVTTDQYQSDHFRQLISNHHSITDKNTVHRLSIDRDNSAYSVLKNLMATSSIDIINLESCKHELKQLINIDYKKVDHPDKGSKDVSDALAGSVFTCYKDGLEALHNSNILNNPEVISHVIKSPNKNQLNMQSLKRQFRI